MPRSRIVYSESHDQSKYPKTPKRGKRGRVASQTPPVGPLPTLPNTQVGFLPPNLSDEQRINLRARQLLADRRESAPRVPQDPQNKPPDRLHPLSDYDLDSDMDVPDPRGQQGNQYDGPVNTIFPIVNGPQFTHTKTRVLPEYAEHPDLPDFEKEHVHASSDLIAAVSADDKTIVSFDNELTVIHTALRRLRQKAERMSQALLSQDDNKGQDDSASSHAQNIVQMIGTIIEPWFSALDEEFNKLLNGTEQGEALEEEGI